MILEKNLSKQAYDQISKLYDEFIAEISNLINHIEAMGSGNLKFLRILLDYNNYYTDYTEAQELYNHKNNSNDENNFDGDENENYEEEYDNENFAVSNNNENIDGVYSNTNLDSRSNNFVINSDGNFNNTHINQNKNSNRELNFTKGNINKDIDIDNFDTSNYNDNYKKTDKIEENPFLNESRNRNTGNNNTNYNNMEELDFSEKKDNLLSTYKNNYEHDFSGKKTADLEIDNRAYFGDRNEEDMIRLKRSEGNSITPENNNYNYNNLSSSNFLGNTSLLNNIQNESSFSRKNEK